MKTVLRAWVVGLVAFFGGCASVQDVGETSWSRDDIRTRRAAYDVEIRRTAFGLPHVKADGYASLGYGVGYVRAEDHLCEIAKEFVLARGEMAKFFGAEMRNPMGLTHLASDKVYRLRSKTDAALNQIHRLETKDGQALIEGFVDGYNRFVRETPRSLYPETCRDAEWVRPISVPDYYRMKMHINAMFELMPLIASVDAVDAPNVEHPNTFGSNGVAIGRDITGGGGALLANPHWMLDNGLAFTPLHMTINGELDVLGAGMAFMPSLFLGFNKDVAWTPPYAAATYQLNYKLKVSDDGQSYWRNGVWEPFQRRTVRVDHNNHDGASVASEHTFKVTHLGPVIENAPFADEPGALYALSLANEDALNMSGALLELARSKTADEAVEVLKTRHATGVLNFLITDKGGAANYVLTSIVHNIDNEHLEKCLVSRPGARPVILDGSRAECEAKRDEGSLRPDRIASDALPTFKRTDYVQNANDTYWLSGGGQPSRTDYSYLVGVPAMQNLRTRYAISRLEKLRETGGGAEELRNLLLSNESYAAELVLDDVVALCNEQSDVEVKAACRVLSKWDRTFNGDQRGAALFHEFAQRLFGADFQPKAPFDYGAPSTTPRGLNVDDPAYSESVLQKLKDAAAQVKTYFGRIDPLWSDAMRLPKSPEGLALHGGPGSTSGVYNSFSVRFVESLGYYAPIFATSVILSVEYTDNGVEAKAMHVASQSMNPASPYYADWSKAYYKKQWIDVPFTERDVKRATISHVRLQQ